MRLSKMGRSLRKSEIKDLRKKIQETLGLSWILLPQGCKVEGFSLQEGEIFTVNGEPAFLVGKDQLAIPLLVLILRTDLPLPRVTVDMKAVPHICNGADVFRPGVKSIDPATKADRIVVVSDEKNAKPICVGMSLMDADAMREAESGKVVRNLHYVGDKIWNFTKTL
ncbi:MAG: RNA-binding protein [Candidatus Atabeyarchaeum deiterrae]